MEITHKEDHLLLAVHYFGGLYSQLTGVPMVFLPASEITHLENSYDYLTKIPEQSRLIPKTVISVKFSAPSTYDQKIIAKFNY